MLDWFFALDPLLQALLGGLLTWGATALAAALVLVRRGMARWLLDMMLGFAAGVMIAASVWSLLIPAMEVTEQNGGIPWLGRERSRARCARLAAGRSLSPAPASLFPSRGR
ncbi:hypothetical protein OO015_03415 [Thermomicrobium sp. 4228-Ro]|nr:hypothetical protein [Thermomicrobium sp. 4228-Ro]MCX2726539.1 hypothetical protein [Thermomicrobium sp. 4228-Ro]